MSNPTLFLSTFNGTLAFTDTGAGGNWTEVDPLRYASLGPQSGLWLEEAGTNYVQNPNATLSAGGLNNQSGVTATRDTTQSAVGYPTCWKIVSNNAAAEENAEFSAPPSFTGQVTYVASANVWSDTPGTTVKIWGVLWEAGYASADIASDTLVVGTTPTAISVLVPMDASVTVIDGYVRIGTDTQAAATIYAADLQFEPAPQTSYIDGSLGDGYAHVGAAWVSAHTRAASSVSVDQDGTARIDPASGAIAFRYKRLIDTAAEEIILTCGAVGSGTDYLEIGIDSSDKLYMEWNSDNAGAERVTSTAANIAVDTEYLFYFDWDSTVIRLSVDNGTLDSDTRDAVEGSWGAGDLELAA